MNRQVPNRKYTIIGDGKVARHFEYYFNLTGITFNQWNRKQSIQQLKLLVAKSDIILLLISDNAIEPFVQKHLCLKNKTLVHFSGVLTTDITIGCHPLMTFGQELYDLKTYQSIPFVCDEDVKFATLFPQLSNKSFNLSNENKAYYHAMCVMAGNFSQMLMRETSKQLTTQLQLPSNILFPYLLQNTKNFIADSENSATGPIQRGDYSTVNKHLQALKGNPLENIYHSFVKSHPNMVADIIQLNTGFKTMQQNPVKLEVVQ